MGGVKDLRVTGPCPHCGDQCLPPETSPLLPLAGGADGGRNPAFAAFPRLCALVAGWTFLTLRKGCFLKIVFPEGKPFSKCRGALFASAGPA